MMSDPKPPVSSKTLLPSDVFQNRRAFPWNQAQRIMETFKPEKKEDLPPIPIDADDTSTTWLLPGGSKIQVFN